ncbi:hypothetical protein Tco_0431864 [Tanacetum coccineum]
MRTNSSNGNKQHKLLCLAVPTFPGSTNFAWHHQLCLAELTCRPCFQSCAGNSHYQLFLVLLMLFMDYSCLSNKRVFCGSVGSGSAGLPGGAGGSDTVGCGIEHNLVIRGSGWGGTDRGGGGVGGQGWAGGRRHLVITAYGAVLLREPRMPALLLVAEGSPIRGVSLGGGGGLGAMGTESRGVESPGSMVPVREGGLGFRGGALAVGAGGGGSLRVTCTLPGGPGLPGLARGGAGRVFIGWGLSLGSRLTGWVSGAPQYTTMGGGGSGDSLTVDVVPGLGQLAGEKCERGL